MFSISLLYQEQVGPEVMPRAPKVQKARQSIKPGTLTWPRPRPRTRPYLGIGLQLGFGPLGETRPDRVRAGARLEPRPELLTRETGRPTDTRGHSSVSTEQNKKRH